MEIKYAGGSTDPTEVFKSLYLDGKAEAAVAGVIRKKEIVKAAAERGITVSDDEVQAYSDDLRKAMKCYSAQETMDYLSKAGLTAEDFEQHCTTALLTARLKDSMSDEGKVQEYFVNNMADFNKAAISIITVEKENLAKEIRMRIEEDGEDFHQVARQDSIDERTKYTGGFAGLITRRTMEPEISVKIFNAKAGDLLGPFERNGTFQLILVNEIIRAELTDSVAETIKERIFSEWLSQFLKDGFTVDG